MKNIAVMVSGGGTNLQSLINCIEAGEIHGRISLVISSSREAYALRRAEKHGIKTACVVRKEYADKEGFDAAVAAALESADPDLVVLAGYLPLLGAELVARYPNRIMNIHPSIIPAFCGKGFYGEKVHQAVLAYGAKVSGATVHFVDEGADSGPIILQKCVPVLPKDDEKTLAARVHAVEHELLPRAVRLFLEGKMSVIGRRVDIDE
ncbi:MAG: phosphoribosylglycinamide formyltransferase [Christensenellales bacterium]